MNVDDFLDAAADEDRGDVEYAFAIESVRRVFEREFPNGAVDAGSSESFEEEFSAASRQRDRRMFWESVYAASVARSASGDSAGEADYALSDWDKRWGKEGS